MSCRTFFPIFFPHGSSPLLQPFAELCSSSLDCIETAWRPLADCLQQWVCIGLSIRFERMFQKRNHKVCEVSSNTGWYSILSYRVLITFIDSMLCFIVPNDENRCLQYTVFHLVYEYSGFRKASWMPHKMAS